MRKNIFRSPSSFRDPDGFVYFLDGRIYRRINESYRVNYDHLLASGLYQDAVAESLLIPHAEVDTPHGDEERSYQTIAPEQIPFVSYPYEWCFSQLKSAALLTLRLQKMAMSHGMTLKDSSAFNVQFFGHRPVFIDTLSFEKYAGGPWVAYRQFCQHFLAPLALMSYRKLHFSPLFRVHLDGIPIDLASRLLPLRTRMSPSLLYHIHLHAGAQKRFSRVKVKDAGKKMGAKALLGMLDNLENIISRLRWKKEETAWSDYYSDTNYSTAAMQSKAGILESWLDRVGDGNLWDLGANTGIYSRIAARRGASVISFDLDHEAVEQNYLQCVSDGESHILPLVLDLTNPSSAIGWANRERMSLEERGPADALMALALVHHLALANNLPFEKIADYMARLGRHLIIEFVPKSDGQAERLLANKKDVYPDYTRECFEGEFSKKYSVKETSPVADSERTMYLMERR